MQSPRLTGLASRIVASPVSTLLAAVLMVAVLLSSTSASAAPEVSSNPRTPAGAEPGEQAARAAAQAAPVVLEGELRLLAADTVAQPDPKQQFKGRSTDVYRQVLIVGSRHYFVKGKKGRPNTRVRVSGTLSGKDLEATDIQTLGAASALPASSGTTRVLVMLAHWNVPDGVTQERARQQMFADSDGWFRDASYTQLGQSGDVTPWMRIPGPAAGQCYGDHWSTMNQAKQAAAALGYDVAAYDNFVLYSPDNSWQAGSDCNHAAGWAYVGAQGTWLNGFMDRRVTVHEQGHNYGLWHAHSHLCEQVISGNCSWSDYGDEYDAMGSSGLVGHFSASQKQILGWMTGRTADLTLGGTATLAPLAGNAVAVGGAVVRATPDRAYWLEYRQPVDFDAALPAYATDGVQLRVQDAGVDGDTGVALLDARPGDGVGVDTATLREGSTWTSPEGFTFSVGTVGPAGVDVTVRVPGAVVIDESFTSSAANFTKVAGGTWAVSSGRYALTAPASTSAANANLSVHNTALTGDFTLTASASTTATTSSWNDFSVVFGYQDTANYYFASFNESNDGATNGIFEVAGGTLTQLADFPTRITAGTLYPIKIERQGAAIRVYRSGTLAAATNDSTLLSGKVGFGSKNDAATFDSLVVHGTRLP